MKPRLKVKKKFIIFLIILFSFSFSFSVAWNPVFYIVLPHFYEFFACSIQVSDAHNRTVRAMPVGGIFLSCSPCSYHSCNFHPDSTFISCPDHSFYINMQLFFTSCNQLADGISHRKLFFIFCHDISHHHILLVMQIKGMCQKSPSFRFCHFLEENSNRSLLSVLNSTVSPVVRI